MTCPNLAKRSIGYSEVSLLLRQHCSESGTRSFEGLVVFVLEMQRRLFEAFLYQFANKSPQASFVGAAEQVSFCPGQITLHQCCQGGSEALAVSRHTQGTNVIAQQIGG